MHIKPNSDKHLFMGLGRASFPTSRVAVVLIPFGKLMYLTWEAHSCFPSLILSSTEQLGITYTMNLVCIAYTDQLVYGCMNEAYRASNKTLLVVWKSTGCTVGKLTSRVSDLFYFDEDPNSRICIKKY